MANELVEKLNNMLLGNELHPECTAEEFCRTFTQLKDTRYIQRFEPIVVKLAKEEATKCLNAFCKFAEALVHEISPILIAHGATFENVTFTDAHKEALEGNTNDLIARLASVENSDPLFNRESLVLLNEYKEMATHLLNATIKLANDEDKEAFSFFKNAFMATLDKLLPSKEHNLKDEPTNNKPSA